jgi:hypothetical protein
MSYYDKVSLISQIHTKKSNKARRNLLKSREKPILELNIVKDIHTWII